MAFKDRKHRAKMTEGSLSLSVITLNANGLNCSIIRQRLTGWFKKISQLYTIYKRFILDPKTQIG